MTRPQLMAMTTWKSVGIARETKCSLKTETVPNDEVNTGTSSSKPTRVPQNIYPSISLSEDEMDEEFNNGEAVYKSFMERKNLKRKRVSTGSRRKNKKPDHDMATGTRKSLDSALGKSYHPMKDHAGLSDSESEHPLAERLKDRRGDFERKNGLKTPPSYNDIVFSDDEYVGSLPEKPQFSSRTTKPPKEHEDILLEYSGGVIPAPIARWLRDYQVEGAEFLHQKFVYQRGGILGDDMGLGKTIQVISFLTAAYGKTGDERDAKRMRKVRRSDDNAWYPRTLIICPGTLMKNWISEFRRWGWWHVDVYHGDGKESVFQTAVSGRLEVLITTYKTYVLYKESLNLVEWDCVVADECHIIKEHKSETTKAMNQVNALCRIGLTGTAIQNKYEELWVLLDWANPGEVDTLRQWKAQISGPLKRGQSHDATTYELRDSRRLAKDLVRNLLPPMFLRRVKTLISDQLPKKSDRVVFCPLTSIQKEAYKKILDSEVVEYIMNSTKMCWCCSGKKQGWCHEVFVPQGGKWQSYVFPTISNLRRLSNHIGLLIPQSSDAQEKQDRDLNVLQTAMPAQWEELYTSRDAIIHFSNPEFCGKWKVLKKLLEWWHHNGDKVLVFSHSVRLLKMLQYLFNHTSYNVSYLDGSITYDERARVVENFNADPGQFVFLLSTRAGGFGLNITSANKIVVVDPNWNPAYDLQAQDRAYRIGQIRDVEVFRLVSSGTIEEVVYARQIYKQQQANIGYTASTERRYFKGVQDQTSQKGEIFGLANLFQFQSENVFLRNIVNQTNVAESKAGVEVVGMEVDESAAEDAPKNKTEKGEDSMMSRLAAEICDERDNLPGDRRPPKANPIEAILQQAGVEYSHENAEVVGPSKTEEKLSLCAQTVKGADDMRQKVFCDPKGGLARKYHPPADVQKRQFCSMARHFGFASATQFALLVEGMTQAQRRAHLERWYAIRERIVGEA